MIAQCLQKVISRIRNVGRDRRARPRHRGRFSHRRLLLIARLIDRVGLRRLMAAGACLALMRAPRSRRQRRSARSWPRAA
jgi:hypothetical protein